MNLYGFIDGTSTSPPKTIASTTIPITQIPNPEYDLWFKRDQLLLFWILSSVTEDIFSYIINLSSSFAIWEALARVFGSVSQNCQLQLNIELHEIKRNDLSISTYLQCAKALAYELSTTGRPLSSAEFNAIIYRNIGSDFHSIITALNLRPDPVPFYKLHAQLVAHEILLKATQEPPLAYVAMRNSTAPLLPTLQCQAAATYSNSGRPLPSPPSYSKPTTPMLISDEYRGNDTLHVGNGQGLQIANTGMTSIPSAGGSLHQEGAPPGLSENGLYLLHPSVKFAYLNSTPTLQ
ncbi:hypothetical protein RJ641_018720 [Dillenia turbinata]|uniref:UBN2_3 domain-containing protein n=1 Tax=Dillenia turbinata TaxID=194707 RepID=A0AAN8UN53_9MAGN